LAPKLASTCESLPTLPSLRTRKGKPLLVPPVSSHIPVSELHCWAKQVLVPGGQVTTRCVCTQLPASQPAVVQALSSVSGHGVLSCCGVHVPVVWSQPRLHWSIVQLGQIGRSLVCELPDCRVALQVASAWPLR